MENKTSAREKEILKFWLDNKIFEKSLAKPSPKGDYVFYDGPPFATGLPHYGHFVASIMKDVVPRYWTMQGYRVERKWGWDCHGLPIENIVEKELGFKTKKDIEKFGIDKFNETCRSKVLDYAKEWEKTIGRLGRWADMDNAYKTMDLSYMETVWWVFKQLWDKDLIYQGYKSMHICPRCETTLSQQEVSEGYKTVTDLAVVAKFELVDQPNTFVLAWTTTPWTLPGNVALAINKDIDYVKVETEDGNYILAKAGVKEIFNDQDFRISGKVKAKELIGKRYKPLFDYFEGADLENQANIYTIIEGDFVTTEEGTGVVHIAPAFGEDDMAAGQKHKLPFIQHVTMSGQFTDAIKDFAGAVVKPADDRLKTDVKIVKYLAAKDLIFIKEKFEHSYPHCWRCDTPLINYATNSWFVKVTAIKKDALKLAKKINWSPDHIKEGRFGKWLEGARDWSISRQRFWASVMPIWKCDKCSDTLVFGSVAELEKASGQKVTDLHKHIIDKVTVKCDKCGAKMQRIPDVLDTWFDSGSMPYAQLHYPFENKTKLESNFPAEFIAEGTDQTRAWFYYLHVIAAALFKTQAFENGVVNGIVLAEDGKKMSKKLNNYPDPNKLMDQYGADALRYYLLTSPVMEAESINFSEKEVKEALQKNIMLLGNILSFYLTYKTDAKVFQPKPKHILDKWILAKLNLLTQEVTEQMNSYNLVKATRPISGFINELSTWYLRRSRERLKRGDGQCLNTLGFSLGELSRVIAPFIPFIAEDIYGKVNGKKESVHLEDWPKVDKKLIDKKIISAMDQARQIVEAALAARAEAGIKVRQPLASYTTSLVKELDTELVELVKDELNILELKFGKSNKLETKISEKLKLQGQMREIIRQINQLRKEQKLTISDKVILYQSGLDKVFQSLGDEIQKATNASELKNEKIKGMKDIEGGKLGIRKLGS